MRGKMVEELWRLEIQLLGVLGFCVYLAWLEKFHCGRALGNSKKTNLVLLILSGILRWL
jgi:hypothetical protein